MCRTATRTAQADIDGVISGSHRCAPALLYYAPLSSLGAPACSLSAPPAPSVLPPSPLVLPLLPRCFL